jgi:hypothetical protein
MGVSYPLPVLTQRGLSLRTGYDRDAPGALQHRVLDLLHPLQTVRHARLLQEFSELRLYGILRGSASGRGTLQRQKGDIVLLFPTLPDEGVKLL